MEFVRGNDHERIHVSVRLRPLNHKEILNDDVSDWECIDDNTVVYKNVGLLASDKFIYPTAYTFDKVFWTDCSTREVYENGAKDVALSVVHGINSTVFAYGETSSGKTYTMTGVTEYAIADIYDYIHKHQERDFVLKFSAMEIYNESVRDMLNSDNTPLRLVDDPERGTTLEKLTEVVLKDKNHANELLFTCAAQRQIADISVNEMSSRSHQIIRLTVESSLRKFLGRDNTSTLAASVNFVDLAGSEQASQSLSASMRTSHVNRSLLTLGTVIRKLSKERNGHIPYKNSKLTRILQTSLDGNARTAVICMMSPARSHVEQSRSTLLFASCAKEASTNAKINVVISDKELVKHLQKELARLENELRGNPSNVVPSNYAAIIREKDYQIEKLEKEIKDLILQRDIAESKVKECIRIFGDDASSSITQVGLGEYPHFRVQKSSDVDTQEMETDDTSDGYSRSSSENHFVRIPYTDQTNAAPRISLSSSNSNESNSYNDQYKEDCCIETSFEENDASLAVKVHVNGSPHLLNDQEFMPSCMKDDIVPSKEGEELVSASSEVKGEDEKEKGLAIATDSFGPSLKIARSKSCNASFLSESSSPWMKKMEYRSNTPCIGSQIGHDIEIEKFSNAENGVSSTSKQSELQTEEVTLKSENEILPKKKNGKDDEGRTGLTSWPVEFKRLQKEVIELWHACNVSLVHRTYFFLLFQGDPSDAIYLEVEIRRMKFLKDKFSRGDKTIISGRRLTLSSSAKAVRNERRMLSEQMSKKFTEEEREILFIEWGIGLNTKLRRMQLAHLVWTLTDDIKHVTDSAVLVAKLVGLIEPGQVPNKELFGMNFAPKCTTGISSFKRSLVSIL